jgi:hypothetical protein
MEEFTSYVDRLKKLATDTSPDELQENLYVFFANGCLLLTSFLQEDGKEGWSSKVINDYGQPILGFKEQANVETIFKSAPWIRGVLKGSASSASSLGASSSAASAAPLQKGGNPTLTNDGNIVAKIADALSQLKSEDISLDAMLQAFIKKTADIDEYMAKLSGPFKKMTSFDIPLGPAAAAAGAPGIPFQPVLYFLLTLLDCLRVSRALVGHKDTPLTILVLLEEIISGQWRQALLTSVGLISPSGVAVGTIAKYFVNVWILINPSLRTEIVEIVFKGTKSAIVGFFIWCISVLPPAIIKNRMKESLEKVTKMFESLQGKLKDMKLKANEKLKPLGKELTFKGFDKLNILAKLTIENLQNLQELSQWSVITCSSEFRAIVDELRPDPLFFFIMEMMNVPLSPKDTLKACNMASNFPSLSQSINPVVVDSDHVEETKTDTIKPFSNPYSTPYPHGTVDPQDPIINYRGSVYHHPNKPM